jgi:hypothetical protein
MFSGNGLMRKSILAWAKWQNLWFGLDKRFRNCCPGGAQIPTEAETSESRPARDKELEGDTGKPQNGNT